jgi:hypothetical protein
MTVQERIKDFLSRVVPWPSEQSDGYVNLHWRSLDNRDKTKSFWGGKPVKDVDSFMGTAAWALQRENIKDIYFCTSLQAKAGKNTKGGLKVMRSKELVVSLKAIWLDVDVKEPPKGYATLEDAIEAIGKFIKDAELPPPSALVATGGGVHVYWISNKPLQLHEWQPYAEGLKALAVTHKLLCDAGVTTDAARILRVPGTFNFKLDTPRPVRILGLKPKENDYDFSTALRMLEGVAIQGVPRRVVQKFGTTLTGKPSDRFNSISNESLSEGLERDEAPLPWEPLVKECAFFREAIKTGGKDYSQPMWNLSTLMATFMEDGHGLAHRMGQRHPEYSRESTDALWERKLRERKDRGLGWPSCAAIQASGCGSCSTCPHFAKGKSPLSLVGGSTQGVNASPVGPAQGASERTVAVEDDLHLPPGYILNGAGYICKLEAAKGKAGEAGETVPVQLFLNRVSSPEVEAGPKALSFTVATDLGNYERVTILAENIINGTEMWKILQRGGLLPNPGQRANGEALLMSWLSKLQDAKAAIHTSPFGWWTNEGKRAGFVYGGKVMKNDGTESPSGAGDRVLRTQYMPCGKIEPWYDAFKVVADQQRPDLEAIVAASFAAPLVVTPAEYSCMLACWGETGSFKSSAVKVGLAVWGHPKITKAVTKTTSRSAIHQMGETKNLPLYWDEIREETLDNLYEVFFDATLGVGPGRLTSEVTQRAKGDWQTMMVTTSNYNFVDHLINMQKSTGSGIYRVFEYEIAKPLPGAPGVINEMDASRTMQELENNFGQMGLKYAKMLGSDPAGIDAFTKDICDKFREEVKAQPSERFWTATCGTLIAGARLANLIGASFNVDALHKWLVEQYLKNRARHKDEANEGGTVTHAEEHLSNFLRDNAANAIYTNTFPQGKGKPGEIKVYHAPRLDRGESIYIQWALDDKVLRFSRSQFRKYLSQQKVPPTSVLRGLATHYNMSQTSAMLGAGTEWVVLQAHLINIPVKEGTPLHELMMAHKPILDTAPQGTSLPTPQPQQAPASTAP